MVVAQREVTSGRTGWMRYSVLTTGSDHHHMFILITIVQVTTFNPWTTSGNLGDVSPSHFLLPRLSDEQGTIAVFVYLV